MREKRKSQENEGIDDYIEKINLIYKNAFPGWECSSRFKKTSLSQFIHLLPPESIIDALNIAISRIKDKDQVLTYFCGICWNRIKSNNGENSSNTKECV